MKYSIVFLVVACFMSACVDDYHPIASGTYISPSGKEVIRVQGDKLHFHIRVLDEEVETFLDRTYKYTVLPDGRIQPHPVTSSDAVFGIGKDDWYWDGDVILRKNPKSGNVVTFSKHEKP